MDYQRRRRDRDRAIEVGRRDRHHRYLDAFAGRQVVYCHRCRAQWFEDMYGLGCPSCQCEATEIITGDHDPRDLETEDDDDANLRPPRYHRPPPAIGLYPPSASQPTPPLGRGSDSDPEEENPDDHMRNYQHQHQHQHHHHHHHRVAFGDQAGAGGSIYIRRTVWDSSAPPFSRGPARQPLDPAAGEDIMRSFFEMISNIAGPPREHLQPPPTGGAGRMTATLMGPTGSSRLTIVGGPQPQPVGPTAAALPGFFGTLWGEGGMRPPPVSGPAGANPNPGSRDGGPDPDPNIPTNLADLMALLTSTVNAGRLGDTVYSQEALDRIVTHLLDQNPPTHAAPPATDTALSRLKRRKVDDNLLESEGGSPECTICIDELNKGQDIAILPCKHWFHEQCVIMWLKEHNTCPICRGPIETGSDGSRSSSPQTRSGRVGSSESSRGRGGESLASPPPDGARPPRSPGLFSGSSWGFAGRSSGSGPASGGSGSRSGTTNNQTLSPPEHSPPAGATSELRRRRSMFSSHDRTRPSNLLSVGTRVPGRSSSHRHSSSRSSVSPGLSYISPQHSQDDSHPASSPPHPSPHLSPHPSPHPPPSPPLHEHSRPFHWLRDMMRQPSRDGRRDR